MNIQETIQKAIEGGWKKELLDFDAVTTEGVYFQGGLYHFRLAEVFLDPLFWQCAFGENGRTFALRFMHHLFDGGTAETFFKDVL